MRRAYHRLWSRRRLGLEDLLDGPLEKLGDREGERKAGIVPAGLDGVDRLPLHAELLGQLTLRPSANAAQLPELVSQGCFP